MKITRWAWIVGMVGVTAGCVMLSSRPETSHHIAATMSSLAQAQWTETTWEAASTPQHRKVLQQAKARTLVGEIVDVSCFLQLGKRGEAHIPCGQKCVRNGQPVGLLTDEGHLYIVFPEEHHPRRDGQVSLKDQCAELMGKRVQVSGMVTETDGVHAVFVRTVSTEATGSGG